MRKHTPGNEFGEWLRRAIQAAGYPHATALAQEAGIDPSSLSRILNGRHRPRLETLELLAPHLGVSVQQLTRLAYPGAETSPSELDPVGRIMAEAKRLVMEAPEGALTTGQAKRLLDHAYARATELQREHEQRMQRVLDDLRTQVDLMSHRDAS